MEYNKLISVTGFSGLFELVTSKTDGAIVRSLEDNTTKFVSSRLHQFSHLESIEVYTEDDNVNLADIFLAMDASGLELPSEKDNAGIRAYFEKAYPKMDFEKVYNSDMKKMIRWFGVIKKNEIEIKLTEMTDEENEQEEEK
jgi:hypothetical protein